MATILYFFPANPRHVNAGNVQRARMLLTYFRERGHVVDLINSDDHWGGMIDEADVLELQRERLIRKHFSLRRKPDRPGVGDFFRFEIPRFFREKIFKVGHSSISDFATGYPKSLFNKILKENAYDHIIISYAMWGNLIKNNPLATKSKTIIDTHDFVTAQEQHWKKMELGIAFSDEMQRLNLFDEIWTVSADEQYLFSQFCQKIIRLMPICMDTDADISTTANKFDLIFTGGDSLHNVTGIRWFFDKVYPNLPTSLRICLVGKINNHFPDDYPNLVRITQADKLDLYYRQSRMAICPMLSGTGVKVKVIEALSHGLPVVCTPKGVDGLLNKRENGCLIAETPKEFAAQIRKLIENTEFYDRIRQNALHYYKNYHSLEHLYRALDDAFGDTNGTGAMIDRP